MEKDIVMLNTNEYISKEKNKKFYTAEFMYDGKYAKIFIDEETYLKISKKFKQGEARKAKFEIINSFNELRVKLVDLN